MRSPPQSIPGLHVRKQAAGSSPVETMTRLTDSYDGDSYIRDIGSFVRDMTRVLEKVPAAYRSPMRRSRAEIKTELVHTHTHIGVQISSTERRVELSGATFFSALSLT